MAIITFTSEGTRETGQTLSVAAFATQMAIEHNYRILLIGTGFQETTLESCFWDLNRIESTKKKIVADSPGQSGIESGLEGLLKIIASNRTSTDIVRNYTRVVFKERLDVLFSPKTTDLAEYTQIAQQYPDILQTANRCYDLVIVDLNKHMEPNAKRAILDNSDVVIMNLTQNLSAIAKTAPTHIQNIAPGPPTEIAIATPAMLPRPTVPDNAVAKAPKVETSPSLSFFDSLNSGFLPKICFREYLKPQMPIPLR